MDAGRHTPKYAQLDDCDKLGLHAIAVAREIPRLFSGDDEPVTGSTVAFLPAFRTGQDRTGQDTTRTPPRPRALVLKWSVSLCLQEGRSGGERGH